MYLSFFFLHLSKVEYHLFVGLDNNDAFIAWVCFLLFLFPSSWVWDKFFFQIRVRSMWIIPHDTNKYVSVLNFTGLNTMNSERGNCQAFKMLCFMM